MRRNAARIALISAAVVIGLARTGSAGDITTGMVFWNQKGDDKRVPWAEIVARLNKTLANAQQVNIYNGMCGGGGLIDAAKDMLTMPYVISAAVPASADATDGSGPTDKGNGRLKVKNDDTYYFGYMAYLAKHLRDKAVPTVGGLHDSITTDMKADPGLKGEDDDPRIATGNKADTTLKITGGTSSTHTLIFNGTNGGLNRTPRLEADRGFIDLGFAKDADKSLQFYYYNKSKQDFQGAKIDGPGSLDNFDAALKTLMAATSGDKKGKEMVNIVLDGHGFRETKEASAAPGGIPGGIRQGEVVSGGATGATTVFNLPMNTEFWKDLAIGRPGSDPTFVSDGQPQFFLSVSEFAMNHAFHLRLDGIDVGDFLIPAADAGTDGSYLEVALSDAVISQLLALHNGDPTISLEFVLQGGDWFRLALLDDLNNDPDFAPFDFGTGLSADVAHAVPEPSSLALVAVGVLGVTVARRLRSTGARSAVSAPS